MARTKLLEIGSQRQPNPELLGVIVEVALDGGLDALAAYGDGTARYLNYAENVIIWESPNEQSNALVDNLWHHSINVVNRIGPDKPRIAPPETGMVRLSFLVSGQIYLGQGPMQPFFQDAMAGPVLHAATQLMQYLLRPRWRTSNPNSIRATTPPANFAYFRPPILANRCAKVYPAFAPVFSNT